MVLVSLPISPKVTVGAGLATVLVCLNDANPVPAAGRRTQPVQVAARCIKEVGTARVPSAEWSADKWLALSAAHFPVIAGCRRKAAYFSAVPIIVWMREV